MFRFEKLDVWTNAIEIAKHVYDFTRTFPAEEKFGLTSQMRRAAISISSNIAEGSGRSSDTDFARFIEFSYGSLMEVISQAEIAISENLIPVDDYNKLHADAEKLARMLSGLRASLIRDT